MKLANGALDEVRRRVQNQTLGHRGHKHDPLYRARKLLISASERISDQGRTKLRGLLTAGDPRGEVRNAWHAKETLRGIYGIPDAKLGAATVAEIAREFQDPDLPPEINRLGRTIWNWRAQISNWHAARVSNGPTEAANTMSASNAPPSGSPTSPTTESAPCYTPANLTGRCSTHSLRPNSRRAR